MLSNPLGVHPSRGGLERALVLVVALVVQLTNVLIYPLGVHPSPGGVVIEVLCLLRKE